MFSETPSMYNNNSTQSFQGNQPQKIQKKQFDNLLDFWVYLIL